MSEGCRLLPRQHQTSVSEFAAAKKCSERSWRCKSRLGNPAPKVLHRVAPEQPSWFMPVRAVDLSPVDPPGAAERNRVRLDELCINVVRLVEGLATDVVAVLAQHLAELHCVTAPASQGVEVLALAAEIEPIIAPHAAENACLVSMLTAVRNAAAPPARAGLVLA